MFQKQDHDEEEARHQRSVARLKAQIARRPDDQDLKRELAWHQAAAALHAFHANPTKEDDQDDA